MKPRNLLWVALGTLAVGLGVLVGGFVRTGRAQDPPPETVSCRADFPVIGLKGTELAQVHASFVEGDRDAVNLKVQFFDRTGQVIQEETKALPPNETVSFTLDPPGRVELSERLEFRAAVFVEPAGGGSGFPAETGCPRVLTSLERMTPRGGAVAVLAPGLPIGWEQRLIPRPCPCPPSPTDIGPAPVDVHPPPDLAPPDMHPPDMPPPVDMRPPPPIDVGPQLR